MDRQGDQESSESENVPIPLKVQCDTDSCQVGKADFPTPEDDEIIVKNHAVAVNPVDWKIQDYGFFIQTWPNVLGEDFAGEVVEVGKNVSKFKKGDRVFA